MFNCLSCFLIIQDALDVYVKLPHKHYNTGWVLSQVMSGVECLIPSVPRGFYVLLLLLIVLLPGQYYFILSACHMLSDMLFGNRYVQLQVGKAYFELVDYLEADRAFSLARQVSPYSLEGMDIYSTVLYVSSVYPQEVMSM